MLMLRSYFLSTNMLSTSKIKTKVVGLDPQKQIWKNIDLLPHTVYLLISTWHSCLGSWRCTSPDWTTVLCSVCKTSGNRCLTMILRPTSKCYNLPWTRLFRSAALSGNPHPQSSRLAVPLQIDPWPRTVNLVRASWCPLFFFLRRRKMCTQRTNCQTFPPPHGHLCCHSVRIPVAELPWWKNFLHGENPLVMTKSFKTLHVFMLQRAGTARC